MRAVISGCAAVLASAAIAAAASAQTPAAEGQPRPAGATFSCTASAGVSKADTAKLTGDVQRTGGYKIRVSTGGEQVLVSAEPESPKQSGGVTRVAAPIDTLLLRSPFKSEAIAQPANIEKVPVQWEKAPSGGGESNRATASFDLKAVQALPKGDVLVIVNTADGERMCRMSAKDRRRIAG
jgi:hypothetical protein